MTVDRPPRQLTLTLPVTVRLSAGDFVVGEPNRAAFALARAPDTWPSDVLCLFGPPGAGKSHLVEVFRASTGARVADGCALATCLPTELAAAGDIAIDGADEADPVALFHLLNAARGAGRRVLLTGASPVVDWSAGLADLASRLRAATPVEIAPPDDGLLRRVLVKQFADRQIAVAPDVVEYCLARMDRSFEAARALVLALDEISLATRRPITKALARPLLRVVEDADDD
jgi:chromosomal replication initiation ATPase DnaA